MAHELGVAEIRSFLDAAKTSHSLEHKLYKVGSLILAYGKERRVGGLTGSAGWGIYCSTKFAVEGVTEALAKELAPLGIFCDHGVSSKEL
jgi:NAD(P)-dependent dehydrogenase (short-subunit alcohol dehydrogenase family)